MMTSDSGLLFWATLYRTGSASWPMHSAGNISGGFQTHGGSWKLKLVAADALNAASME